MNSKDQPQHDVMQLQKAVHNVLTESRPWHQSQSASSMAMQSKGMFVKQLLLQGLAASGGKASVLRNAAASAACGAVAVTASESVEFTVPVGQAATARAVEPAAEAVEEAVKSSASVGAAQEAVPSAAGAEAGQEAVESPAGLAHAASGTGPFRQAADSVIEASMSSATERVAIGGSCLQPPQPCAAATLNSAAEASSEAEQLQALVQAFTQAFVQRAMVAGTSQTSSAPESVTAAVLSVWNKALNTDDLQRGSAASGHKLAAIEASVASADSAACPAADLRGSAADLRGTACPAADLRGTACPAAAGATAATLSNSDGTAGSAAPAAATPSSAPQSGSTAARLTSADETAAASMVGAAVDVSKPSPDETAAASTADAAVDVSKPGATDAAKLDALHYAGAGPAKLQLMGQDDVPRLVGSGAVSTWHGYA